MLKLFKKIEGLYGFRNSGVPVYQDFYTMKIDLANCSVSREFLFNEVTVWRGSTVSYSSSFSSSSSSSSSSSVYYTLLLIEDYV